MPLIELPGVLLERNRGRTVFVTSSFIKPSPSNNFSSPISVEGIGCLSLHSCITGSFNSFVTYTIGLDTYKDLMNKRLE